MCLGWVRVLRLSISKDMLKYMNIYWIYLIKLFTSLTRYVCWSLTSYISNTAKTMCVKVRWQIFKTHLLKSRYYLNRCFGFLYISSDVISMHTVQKWYLIKHFVASVSDKMSMFHYNLQILITLFEMILYPRSGVSRLSRCVKVEYF